MDKDAIYRKIIGNTSRFIKKNSGIILSIIASAGVVATAVTVAKAVPKAQNAVKKAEEDKGSELTKYETIKAEAPSYALPVAIGAATIVTIVSNCIISEKKQRDLIAACGMWTSAYKNYRKKLIELHGKEADEEVQMALAREYAGFHHIGLDIPDEKAIWLDELSGQTIVAYEREIMDAEYHLNRNFVMRGYSPLNELYQFLGMRETEEGEALGWSVSDGYCWIDFEHRRIDNPDDGGMPMYAINYVFYPDADYLREWNNVPDYSDDSDNDISLPWEDNKGVDNNG